jgi:hypothetical protein
MEPAAMHEGRQEALVPACRACGVNCGPFAVEAGSGRLRRCCRRGGLTTARRAPCRRDARRGRGPARRDRHAARARGRPPLDLRHRPPCQHIRQAVHHLAHRHGAPTPAVLGAADQWRDQSPLGIRQTARVAQPVTPMPFSVSRRPHRRTPAITSGHPAANRSIHEQCSWMDPESLQPESATSVGSAASCRTAGLPVPTAAVLAVETAAKISAVDQPSISEPQAASSAPKMR